MKKIIKGGQGKSDEQLYQESELLTDLLMLLLVLILGIGMICLILEVVR